MHGVDVGNLVEKQHRHRAAKKRSSVAPDQKRHRQQNQNARKYHIHGSAMQNFPHGDVHLSTQLVRYICSRQQTDAMAEVVEAVEDFKSRTKGSCLLI